MEWGGLSLMASIAAACVAVAVLLLRRRPEVQLAAAGSGAEALPAVTTEQQSEAMLAAPETNDLASETGRGDMFETLRDPQVDLAALAGNTFVAVVEVDRFAALRQSIGYRLSNTLMAELADRIAESLADSEIGRVGRTTIEFAFRAESAGAAQLRLLDMVAVLERRMTVDDFTFDLSVTIGFADAGSSSIRDELVDQAAAALAVAQKERVKVGFADLDLLSQNSLADLELMRGLSAALQSGEVDLHYQPKLEARTNKIRGVEALVRWTRDGRLVPTARFVQLAEETGTIRELTEWVIARAVRDQKKLAEAGWNLEISVNISAHVLPDADFAELAMDLVADAVGDISFEITETAVIDDPEAAFANLHAFRSAGIRIAIDDYGSGLSSLAYLKQLPAHELKIDRLFISGLTDSHRDPLLVRSSIDLAHALEMEVTAEGVDDPMALQLLRVMGCDLLQGFYISVPLPLDKLTTFLSNESHIKRLAESPLESQLWQRFTKR